MQSAERQTQFSSRRQGVITCFLSLVLLVILALVFVSLESARSAGARFLAQSYTQLAADSVMAGYSSVLFDRYHIFAYNSRAGTGEDIRSVLQQETEHYIDRNLQAGNKQLWMPTLYSVEVEQYERLTERGGSLFREEAANYMKYRGVPLMAETLLSSLGLFQGAQKTVQILETKAKTEEALAEIDTCILELFESVDGFKSDEEGIQQNIWGRIKTKEYFVKKLLCGTPTAETTQINHPVLLDAIRDSYLNPQTEMGELDRLLIECEGIEEQLARLNSETESLRWELWQIQQQEKELREKEIEKKEQQKQQEQQAREQSESVQKKEESVEQTMGEEEALTEARKQELAKQREEITDEIEELEEAHRSRSRELRNKQEDYRDKLKEWRAVVEGCYEAGRRALRTIETIRTKQRMAEGKVFQYERELLGAAEWMEASLHEELAKGIETMKQYVDLETEGVERVINLEQMRETLIGNGHALSQMLQAIENDGDETTRGDRTRFNRMFSQLTAYSHEGLRFDYSGLHLESEGKSPVKGVKELVEKGIAGLVIKDFDAVSKEKLNRSELVSLWDELGLDRESEENEDGVNRTFSGLEDMNASESLFALGETNPFENIAEQVGAAGEALAQRMLFLGYLAEHFSSFESGKKADSVLAYEQEYILCGETDDSLNLNEMAGKLFLVRFIFNLIHVLSDTEKCNTALGSATALLGMTGLPILVSILKFLILFVWAAEGALVETSALLQGKKLAIMPMKMDFPVAFSEIPVMSRTRIVQKAEAMQSKGGLALGYSEYLLLFLLLQKEETQNLRALDLIQENLRLKERDFTARQQICSFSVKIEYTFSELFSSFSFVKRRTGGIVCRTKAFAG